MSPTIGSKKHQLFSNLVSLTNFSVSNLYKYFYNGELFPMVQKIKFKVFCVNEVNVYRLLNAKGFYLLLYSKVLRILVLLSPRVTNIF